MNGFARSLRLKKRDASQGASRFFCLWLKFRGGKCHGMKIFIIFACFVVYVCMHGGRK